MEEKARQELLKSIYEQHWLHARHVENERLWFTNIFVLIVAGLLAFLGTTDKQLLPLFALFIGGFIFILSMLGYLLCLTWRAPFLEHTTLARKMLEDSLLEGYVPYTTKAFKKLKGRITAHKLFLHFYALMAGGGLSLILYVGLAWSYWWVSLIVALLISCVLWRWLFKKKEDEYHEKMGVRDCEKSNS